MFQDFVDKDPPIAGNNWVSMDEASRLEALIAQIQTRTEFSGIRPTRTSVTGQVYVAIKEPIASSLRGGLLLDLEEYLKNTIDPAINIWCEPLGDRNSLRNLRGIEIKSPIENFPRRIEK